MGVIILTNQLDRIIEKHAALDCGDLDPERQTRAIAEEYAAIKETEFISEVLHELGVKGPRGIQPPTMGGGWELYSHASIITDLQTAALVKSLQQAIKFRREQKAADTKKYRKVSAENDQNDWG